MNTDVFTHSETEIAQEIKHPEIPIKPGEIWQYREDNNTAVLWQQNDPEKKYDFHGDATIDNQLYWVTGYSAFKKNGERYLRLYFRRIKPESRRWDKYAKASRTKHRAS